ncbi:MAG: SUMF1/EgtB/PvdO family nonheme iron enzyme [Salinivirgaceae bacterium]|nr:SUMF1/EgtB/PvdO family nonheme iron enzyme [Salinivirgaceae bacterium]
MTPNTIIDNRYELKKTIGRGSFGEVWLATDIFLEQDVALKFYVAMDNRGCCEFREEYRKVFRLHHDNLLTPSYYAEWNGQPYLVMEYCTDSASHLIGKADEPTIWQFIADVSAGLAYMHGSNPTLVHQDIKPANVLRKTDGHFAITDFGISVSLRSTMLRQSGREASSSVGGSIPYMGPELFGAKPVSIMASDVWALGVTIYEIATGELPFLGQGGVMLKAGAELPDLGDKWSVQLNNLLKMCLSLNTWDRPTANKIHEYATAILNNTKSCELVEFNNHPKSSSYASTVREFDSQSIDTQNPCLKLNTDVDCKIAIDGDLCGEVLVGQIKKMPLRQGDYILQFISLINPADSYSVNLSMPNADKVLDIHLNPVLSGRENEEQRQYAIEQKEKEIRLMIEKYIAEMVYVECGTFWMGAHSNIIKNSFFQGEPDINTPNYDMDAFADESPVHKVTLDSFHIGKYPVTQGLWSAIMENNPSYHKNDKYPVENVSWNDCDEFIKKLNQKTSKNFRLPTEAEWEYAARGGNKSHGYKFAGSDNIVDVAWLGSTHPVGEKAPNELNLYDMSGNVWEWCQDWYNEYYSDSQINPVETDVSSYKVLRGGGWNCAAKFCRVSCRCMAQINLKSNNNGLRLVCSNI